MYTIEEEIFNQPSALAKTRAHLDGLRETLKTIFKKYSYKIIFIGCGSSYMLSEGAASIFSMYTNRKAYAFTGGEIMLDPDKYEAVFENSLVIVTSRSGETSEVILALNDMKKRASFKTLGITAKSDCTLNALLDYIISIPWAFDESVCQTRTISNFYFTLCKLLAFHNGDQKLENALDDFILNQHNFLIENSNMCKEIAAISWNNVTVLADGEICGIASEGSLAFTEICMLPGEYFKLLDYRHGPIVLANSDKLVLVVLNNNDEIYQKQMIADLKDRGAHVITFHNSECNIWGSDYHISLANINDPIAYGLPFINICQMIAFYKAIAVGHNPDEPDGLSPYISLETGN